MSQTTATFFGNTDPGRIRSNNEDTFIATYVWDNSHLLLAAIDGVGGYEGGEVAAAIARDTIISEVRKHPIGDSLELLKSAVTKANNSIVDHKSHDPQRSRMGCVISSAIIDLDKKQLYMVHLGDSRLYRFTQATGLEKLSHDHSLIGYREEQGFLTEEQAMNHPQRNIIERSLGDTLHSPDDPNFLDTASYPIYETTQFLFCSDGLSDMLYSANIASVLQSGLPVETKVKTLIDMANQAGGKDNITVVIAKVEVPESNSNNVTTMPTAQTEDTDYEPEPEPAAEPQPSDKPAPRVGLPALIVSIAAAFIAGGTAGYFVGEPTGRQRALDEIKAEAPLDSVVPIANNPDSILADSLQVGPQEADSVNRAAKAQADSARQKATKTSTPS